MKKIFSLVLFLALICTTAFSQEAFTVHVVPSTITAVPAIHSGAFATRNNKWIFIGGRQDGIHIMQANQGFSPQLRNQSIFIVDPVANTSTSTSTQTLPPSIREALSSTNMEYFQRGQYLYMIGGYGFEDTSLSYMTFPSLISIDLDCLQNAASTSGPIDGCFRQIIDSNMAVCGGELGMIDSTFYLVCGHRFDGVYSKPPLILFTQHYTHDIRKFTINDDGVNLSIGNYVAMNDTDVFHRRDFNLVPQIYPNGDTGMTVFGGVFQKNADQPFLTPIDISSSGVQHQSSFNENLNQYTTASLPLYDATNKYMHTIFFGGLSLYRLDTISMNLIQDTLVPFVSTISKVSRDSLGNLVESKLPEEMPSLKGTNAIFIPDTPLVNYHGIIDLNSISGNKRVGFIAGGIHSDAPNVADIDPVGMSRANTQLYEVYIDKTINGIPELELHNEVNNLVAYPNPVSDNLYVSFSINHESNCEINLYDEKGALVHSFIHNKKLNGLQHFTFDMKSFPAGAYNCHIHVGNSEKVIRVIK